MGTRMSTLGTLGFVAAIALLLPMGLGQLFTVWRSQVEAELPPVVPPPVTAPELPPAPVPPPAPERVPNLRPIDGVMFGFAEVAFRLESGTDVRPGKPYRIDLVREGEGAVRAKLDLDRDGQFDEVWTYGRTIVREVSSADDGVPTARQRWDGFDWVPEEEVP